MHPFSFSITKKIPRALGRAGVLHTPHGVIETPAFVAVGTKATVKSLTPEMLVSLGAQVVLANTFHLYLEPGEKIVEKAGGVGAFMGWKGPTMTDSGGFQVFSLGAGMGKGESKIKHHHPAHHSSRHPMFPGGKHRVPKTFSQIDEDGVSFTSPLDGSKHRFTPEQSIEIQRALGADIIFAFDECTSPSAPRAYQKEAMARTHRWALRSLVEHERSGKRHAQALFGIVQGGRYKDLREESARAVAQTRHGGGGFDGFGIGGSFDKDDVGTAVRFVNRILHEEKPRHLLGIGGVVDLFAAVENGCDTFDCVAPTREARTGALYTAHGRINITNARFRADFSPIDKKCPCYTCTNFTKAYIAHLFRARELLAYTLASIHNLHFFISLVSNMRGAILDGGFLKYKKEFLAGYK